MNRFTTLKNFIKRGIFRRRLEKAFEKSLTTKTRTVKNLNPDRIGQKRFMIPKGCHVWIYDFTNKHLEPLDHTDKEAMKQFFLDLKQTDFKNKFVLIHALNQKNAERKVERFHELNPHI